MGQANWECWKRGVPAEFCNVTTATLQVLVSKCAISAWSRSLDEQIPTKGVARDRCHSGWDVKASRKRQSEGGVRI